MTYRERRARRAERLREWADKREAKSAAGFKKADRIASAIPMGQPILVGHHSERRHRRDLERIDSGMRAGIEHQEKAHNMNMRAAEIERQAEHAIYSDDPDAIERLTEKIAALEARREKMKTDNAAFRKTHRAELAAMTSAYERDQAMPHQAYELQNLGGNITRARQRLKDLSGQPARAAAATADASTATARAGLIVTAGMTTPSRPGKQPRPVWNVTGNLGPWRQTLTRIGGNWYHGVFSFWDDPTEDLEAACVEDEGENSPHGPQCAQRFATAAECTCGKADRDAARQDAEDCAENEAPPAELPPDEPKADAPEVTARMVKLAWKRDPTIPIGTPSPLHLDCPCGLEVPITDAPEMTCDCGARYDRAGYILETAAEAFAKHRDEDPHCTCNDCLAYHTEHLEAAQ